MRVAIVWHGMVHAYVMIKTGAGESDVVVERIRGLSGILEAHIVAGAYDVVAEVEAEEVYDILRTASSEIQTLDGIDETRTYIALD